MKKLLVISLSSILFLSACGSEQSKEPSDSANGGAAQGDNSEVKKEMMRFYMAVPNTINEADGDLNLFEQQQMEGLLPEGEELETMKASAMESAKEASQAVEDLEIPESLNEKREELESALSLISESYDMKADAITKEETSFEAAGEKFAEADGILNTVLEEYELISSSIQNEVN